MVIKTAFLSGESPNPVSSDTINFIYAKIIVHTHKHTRIIKNYTYNIKEVGINHT